MTNLPVHRKWAWLIVVSALASVSSSSSDPGSIETLVRAQIHDAYGTVPLSFEANQGQTAPAVRFLSRGHRYNLYLTDREAVLALHRPHARTPDDSPAVIRMTLVDASFASAATGLDELPSKSHYLIGNDPQRWHTDVRQYAKVRYAGVYPGIDLVYYGNQGQLEYDFVISAGADPQQIQLAWPGARDVRVSESGELVVAVDGGEIVQHKPVMYQMVDGVRHEIAGGYRLSDEHRVTFHIGGYDRSRELVIDPVLSFATYLGGSDSGVPFRGDELGIRIAVDRGGHAYVFGTTTSMDFPTTEGARPRSGPAFISDLFITKFNRNGTGLEYSTYLGGSSFEGSGDIAVDNHGQAYLIGSTLSPDFPVTPGAFQRLSAGSEEGFVTKLNRRGTGLVYSSYLGGSGSEEGTGIAVDKEGSAYVAGRTFSSDFPIVEGAYKSTKTDSLDLFVTKVNPMGTALVYSTYLGGMSLETAAGIAVDDHHNAFVVGLTFSSDFPTTPDAAMPAFSGGGADGFVAKLNRDASALVYSTFIGGSGTETAVAIALDKRGRAHVTGGTFSPDFPVTPDAFQPTHIDFDAFIAMVSHDGTAFVHASYLGGSNTDAGAGIAVDDDGRVHVTGQTDARDFPVTPDAFQPTCSCPSTVISSDAFVTVVDWNDASLVFSTYLGGSTNDRAEGIALDKRGNAYVAGGTWSRDFPTTPGAFQPSHAGGLNDAFVVKIEHDRRKDRRR